MWQVFKNLHRVPLRCDFLTQKPLCRSATSPLKGRKISESIEISLTSTIFSPCKGECPKGEGVLKLKQIPARGSARREFCPEEFIPL
jgi:hypothetical protein